ncbi:organic cation transporter protein-like [Tubulanus polymorphus]|uniref:organic cation transporter protein-like n=1 Tax=Tubulanus polymorphus TaxID=672921 RepID=UPI003DA40467
MQVDEALDKLGFLGLWQTLVYTGWSISCCFTASMSAMSAIFMAAMPEQYHCRLSENETFIVNANNETDKCHVYRNGTGKIPCSNGIEFQNVDFGSSIITEWELVCSRNLLGELAITLNVLGSTLGSFCLPILSDKYGRKRTHYIFLILYSLTEAGNGFAPNYSALIALRIISGFMQTGVYASSFVAACEVFPAKYRTYGGIFVQVWWAIGMLFLCMCAYLIRNWRYIQMIVGFVPLVTFSYFLCIPESVPWLAGNGKVEEAEKIIVKAAKMNKKQMPVNPLRGNEDRSRETKNKKNSNIKEVLKCRILRKYLLCLCFIW